MKANTLTALRSQKLTAKPKTIESRTLQPTSPSASRGASASVTRTTATMSLYPTDHDRLKEIRRVLEDSGIKRVSDSEAVRVALRLVPLSPNELIATYRVMQADDGRRKQDAL